MRNGALDQPPHPGRSSIGHRLVRRALGRPRRRCSRPGRAPARGGRCIDVNGPPSANGVSLYTLGVRPGHARAARLGRARRSRRSPPPRRTSRARRHRSTGCVCKRRHADPADRRRARRPRHGRDAPCRRRRPPGQHREDPPDPQAGLADVVHALGGGPVLVKSRPAGLPRERAVHARPAARAHGAHRGRPARRRAPPARHRRRRPARLQRGRDELRARPGDGQARRRHGGGARRRRLGDDGLRRAACSARRSGPERPIGDALLVSTRASTSPPPLEPVLSPNGDGVAERQRLAYKLVRPSNVTASSARPRRCPALHASPARRRRGRIRSTGRASRPTARRSSRAAGAGSSPRPTTPAQASTAERTFQLNRTLGFAAPVAPALAVPRPQPRAVADLQAHPRGDGDAPDRDRLRRPRSGRSRSQQRRAGRPPGRLGRPHRRRAPSSTPAATSPRRRRRTSSAR